MTLLFLLRLMDIDQLTNLGFLKCSWKKMFKGTNMTGQDPLPRQVVAFTLVLKSNVFSSPGCCDTGDFCNRNLNLTLIPPVPGIAIILVYIHITWFRPLHNVAPFYPRLFADL